VHADYSDRAEHSADLSGFAQDEFDLLGHLGSAELNADTRHPPRDDLLGKVAALDSLLEQPIGEIPPLIQSYLPVSVRRTASPIMAHLAARHEFFCPFGPRQL